MTEEQIHQVQNLAQLMYKMLQIIEEINDEATELYQSTPDIEESEEDLIEDLVLVLNEFIDLHSEGKGIVDILLKVSNKQMN